MNTMKQEGGHINIKVPLRRYDLETQLLEI